MQVNHGAQYLLRLINANAYNCPIRLSTSGHDFRVSAADGNLVQPLTAKHIVLFPGTFHRSMLLARRIYRLPLHAKNHAFNARKIRSFVRVVEAPRPRLDLLTSSRLPTRNCLLIAATAWLKPVEAG